MAVFDAFNAELFERLALIAAVVVVAHFTVILVKRASEKVMTRLTDQSLIKVRTINSLITSILVFSLYFGALGWALNELGVPLTAYLASASIIGLAVGFGSQGIVQDVVTGLTVVLSNQFDVGAMVQIGDQIGVVQRIGMRFTVLENAMGAQVMIPNRLITNVTSYPRGYVRVQVDVTLPVNTELADEIENTTRAMTTSVVEQFAGVFRAPPEFMGRFTTSNGKVYFRVKFRIWPGRVAPVEAAFKQELIPSLKRIDPDYADWMVAVNSEVEKPSRRKK